MFSRSQAVSEEVLRRYIGYQQVERSELLPDLDITLLVRCLMMASKVEALKAFQQGIAPA